MSFVSASIGNPSPNVASFRGRSLREWHLALFCVAECPNRVEGACMADLAGRCLSRSRWRRSDLLLIYFQALADVLRLLRLGSHCRRVSSIFETGARTAVPAASRP